MSEPLLRVEGLVTSFPAGEGPRAASRRAPRVPVVDGVDLQVSAGEVLALVGESGCGKSLTALSCLRLVPRPGRIEAGRIRLAGRELLSLPISELRDLRGREAAMIFQEPTTSLNPVQTVGSQIVEAIRLHERVSRRAARARAAQLFDDVGIPDASQRLDAFPHQLSGGLRQRVMIAMALALRPRLLIADEPTTALDVTIQAQILELLRALLRDYDTAILLITHDLGVVNQLADRIAVMYAGRIAESGGRSELLRRPAHPYTQGLLRAMPSLGRRGEALEEIPGVVPPADALPPGCRFASRCPRVFEACERSPEARELAPGHRVHCHAVEAQRSS